MGISFYLGRGQGTPGEPKTEWPAPVLRRLADGPDVLRSGLAREPDRDPQVAGRSSRPGSIRGPSADRRRAAAYVGKAEFIRTAPSRQGTVMSGGPLPRENPAAPSRSQRATGG